MLCTSFQSPIILELAECVLNVCQIDGKSVKMSRTFLFKGLIILDESCFLLQLIQKLDLITKEKKTIDINMVQIKDAY